MNKNIITSESRGSADHGWLKSYHSFSFASYQDIHRMGFGALRVINDDCVAPGKGFATHPHKNMEIVSIPLSGSLRHKDNQGNETVITTGEVQIMSAGTGVAHSEYNDSNSSDVNFLQIWILPKTINTPPRYAQKKFDPTGRFNTLQTVVSPIGSKSNGVEINQNAYFSLADMSSGKSLNYNFKTNKSGLYIFIINGEISLDTKTLNKRDAIEITEASTVALIANVDSQLLFIEVPMHL